MPLQFLNQILAFVAQLSNFELLSLILSTENFDGASGFPSEEHRSPYFLLGFTAGIQHFTRRLALGDVESADRFRRLQVLRRRAHVLEVMFALFLHLALLYSLKERGLLGICILFFELISALRVDLLYLSAIESVDFLQFLSSRLIG
jgi:hypothetical protein